MTTYFIAAAALASGFFLGFIFAIWRWNPDIERMFWEEKHRNEQARNEYLERIRKQEQEIVNYEIKLKKIEDKIKEYSSYTVE